MSEANAPTQLWCVDRKLQPEVALDLGLDEAALRRGWKRSQKKADESFISTAIVNASVRKARPQEILKLVQALWVVRASNASSEI